MKNLDNTNRSGYSKRELSRLNSLMNTTFNITGVLFITSFLVYVACHL